MKVYLDAVATTAIEKEVLNTYKELLDNYYANSDALYDDGIAVFDMQEKARKNISELLNINKDEIIFTSGASEANNMAIKGYCLNKKKGHIITSIYEHSSVYNAIKQLEDNYNFEITYLKPIDGIIDSKMVLDNLRDDTILVSIMAVNNEIGSINNIEEIGKIVKKHKGTCFHSDITQAISKYDIDLNNIDMASFSAHKLHGLKGSGVLIKKQHIDLLPLISGGQQEYSLRGGTSNSLVNIVFAKTLRLAFKHQKENIKLIDELYDYLINELNKIEGIKINLPKKHIKQLINITTPIQSEVLLNALNEKGIMLSSKSTCGSRKNEKNRSYETLNILDDYSIRISFDYTNNLEELNYFIENLKEIINKYA